MDFETIAAYLAGECSEAERQAIEGWRQADARNEQDFQRWQLVWQASQARHQDFKPDTSAAWQRINPAKETTIPLNAKPLASTDSNKSAFIWLRNLAAICLVTIGLSLIIWQLLDRQNTQAIEWAEQSTEAGDTHEILLADGSKIWLNAQSRLRYPKQFDTHSREVHLEGEAYFEVAHQPHKPFRVHTPAGVTEVLGTSFHVRGYPDEPVVEVNLISGQVAFSLPDSSPDLKKILQPGQKAVLIKAIPAITLTNNENQNYLAWKTNNMVFQETLFRDALHTLQAYYGVEFLVADSLLLNCRFTGTFDNAPLEDVLEIFAFGSDISYQKQGNQYVLSGPGCR